MLALLLALLRLLLLRLLLLRLGGWYLLLENLLA
jgi:hypothetical protein